jgi:hypothetical protein
MFIINKRSISKVKYKTVPVYKPNDSSCLVWDLVHGGRAGSSICLGNTGCCTGGTAGRRVGGPSGRMLGESGLYSSSLWDDRGPTSASLTPDLYPPPVISTNSVAGMVSARRAHL